MIKLVKTTAIAVAVSVGGVSGAVAGAIPEACYMKTYEPAEYRDVISRKLLRKEFKEWENLNNGPGLVRLLRHPNVYIETKKRKLVRKDRYVLRRVDCK